MSDQFSTSTIDLVVNWHVIEACNFKCKYCFAHWDERGSTKEALRIAGPLFDQIASIAGRRVKTATGSIAVRSVRLNFAGGEPFLIKRFGTMIEAAADRGLAPSFISNGSLISDHFIADHARQLSVAGFSFDATDPEVSVQIGRTDRKGKTFGLDRLVGLADAFRATNPAIRIKVNTVVCDVNHSVDLRPAIERIRPDRWKVLRVLPGNGGEAIPDAAFKGFVQRHRGVPGMVVEDNPDMRGSYLMIDPAGRFFQNTTETGYPTSPPILDVGIDAALRAIPFYADRFVGRYAA